MQPTSMRAYARIHRPAPPSDAAANRCMASGELRWRGTTVCRNASETSEDELGLAPQNMREGISHRMIKRNPQYRCSAHGETWGITSPMLTCRCGRDAEELRWPSTH